MAKIPSIMDSRLVSAVSALVHYGVVSGPCESDREFMESLRTTLEIADRNCEDDDEAAARPGTDTGTTLRFEMERFAADYPNLKVYFERSPDPETGWQCMITTMTMMYGEYGIFEGEGRKKRLALLDARRKPDAEREERSRIAREESLRAAAALEKENRLDEAVYGEI